jgi:hypothetical protein
MAMEMPIRVANNVISLLTESIMFYSNFIPIFFF